jgi:hypothetical protein
MTAHDEIEIPVIEIGPGWTVDEIETLDDCDDAHAYLTGALCAIENRIIEMEEICDTGPVYRRLVSARRWKKAGLSVVQTKRAKLNRAERERLGDDGRQLRDLFAAHALASLPQVCAHDTLCAGTTYEQHLARNAYKIADAMLAERANDQ